MTRPNVVRDLLIMDASFSLTPVAPVASLRSLPARSTRFILLERSRSLNTHKRKKNKST